MMEKMDEMNKKMKEHNQSLKDSFKKLGEKMDDSCK